MDRKLAPEISNSHEVNFIKPTQKSGEVNFFQINNPVDESIRLEVYFDAGSKYQSKKLQASILSSMLLSGIPGKDSKTLNDEIDTEGGYFQCEADRDFITLTIYCLSSKFEAIWNTIEEAILNVDFPQEEFDNLMAVKKQKFEVNSEKVSSLARREFAKLLFEKDSPYDTAVVLEDYNKLSRNDIQEFYQSNILNGLKGIFLVGDLDEALINRLVDFSIHLKSNVTSSIFEYENQARIEKIKKGGAIQSAIRIGRTVPNRGAEEFVKLQVLNTVFGGYFGSRLMANIREDKGYTYGIGSGIVPQLDGAYFFISTEVGSDVREDALKEIEKEMNLLKTDLIQQSELDLVLNYMQGQFLKGSDGPFSMMDRFKSIWFFGLDYKYYDSYMQVLKSIDSNELKALANKYLNWEDMSIVTAG